MAFLRKRESGNYSLSFKWKGKSYIKALGTDNEQEAEQIRKDADEQLDRIRKGRSALAAKLLADGHSIVDVLFGSDEIAHLIEPKPDDNSLTLSELRDGYIDHLRANGRSPGHLEGTRIHLDHFIRVLGDRRVASLTDADMDSFHRKREKENAGRTAKQSKKTGKKSPKKKTMKAAPKRLVSQGTIRADFKSLKAAINWAMNRKPPLLKAFPCTIPSVASNGPKPFLPTEEIERQLERLPEDERKNLLARWVLDLDEINGLVKLAEKKMPEMALPLKLICSTGMRRIQLVRLRPQDYYKGALTIRSRKGARQKGLDEIELTIELRASVAKELEQHIKALPKRCDLMFPILDEFDYSRGNERWKGQSKRTVEQRRCDRADRLFEKLVKDSDFERLDGYHALRHSFISILVGQGGTWDQIAAFVGHLDRRTTQRYIHFMPKDKRATVESVPFGF